MKIAIAQINTSVGDIEGNYKKIVEYVKMAIADNYEVVVFPELTITGYPPKDLLYDEEFVEKSVDKINLLAQKYSEKICIIVGGVRKSDEIYHGKAKLFNTAFVIKEGQILYQDKKLLPNYSVFDERRYFVSGLDFYNTFNINGKNIAVTICEDIWEDNYKDHSISENYKDKGLDVVINLSSSPFSISKIDQRRKVINKFSDNVECPMVYVNQIGGQDDLVFDGSSMVCKKGEVYQIGKSFEEQLILLDTDKDSFKEVYKMKEEDLVLDALVIGVRDYFHKSGFKKAIIGLSGGVDSALVAVVAAIALGSDNVTGVLMPSKYSSGHSVTDAYELANNLKINTMMIPISKVHEETYKQVQSCYFNNSTEEFKSLTDQNMQARIRGQFLMMLSNETGGLVLSTGNKSECAVGYCTLYGDMAGGLNVLGDVYKTTVFSVCKRINRLFGETIPRNIITKPPSAELAPDQKDSNELPEYDVLDNILKMYIEDNKSTNQIIEEIGMEEVVLKTIRRVNMNEYKRRQSAPMIIISDRDLLNSRRFPIVNNYK